MSENIQLTVRASSGPVAEGSVEAEVHLNESNLAPVDKGFGAWSFLIAAFFIEAIVWGFPDAYGIILDGYFNDPRYSAQAHASTVLPLIGPVASGVMMCSGPLIYPLTARYPQHRRTAMWFGLVLCWASLFTASYISKISTLVALQGVLYAIGGSLLYAPCISYLAECPHWKEDSVILIRVKGTAMGGIVLPLAIPRLISAFGVAKALCFISIGIAVVLIPLLPFVKPRIPLSRTSHATPPRNRDWMTDKPFWVVLVINTLIGFAYYLPLIWLPMFASDLNISASQSSLAIALLNGSSLIGRISLGYLSDKLNPWSLALCILFPSSLVTFIIWGLLSKSLAGLICFGIAYGSLAGSWTSLWSGFWRLVAY
ncbi:MFS general substrate transporter [Hymenopellis radicata]|nr:MFS general substrate transporter [Hymenopellis radicata]